MVKKSLLGLYISVFGLMACNSSTNEEKVLSSEDSAAAAQPAAVNPIGIPADSVVNLDTATEPTEDTAIH